MEQKESLKVEYEGLKIEIVDSQGSVILDQYSTNTIIW